MPKIPVNPVVIKWARETAGLTLFDAAQKVGLSAARSKAAMQRLDDMETGREKPTRSLLVRMSKQYRRPLVTFYLEKPPPRGDRGQDFRRLPEDYGKDDEALVDALLRNVRVRQKIVRAVLEDEDEAMRHPFVGSVTSEQESTIIAGRIISDLNFSREEFRSKESIREAFAYLRGCAEGAGVFVLLAGDLGSHHSQISVEAFRGFAIADDIAPFVVVNNHDARAAWSFTLLHELSHLWLGQTGISGAFADSRIEQLCNDVAGKILLSPKELNEFVELSESPELDVLDRVSNFARERNISRSMVVYSLFREGLVSEDVWKHLRTTLRQQYFDIRESIRTASREHPGGPNWYVVRRHRVGEALLSLVSRGLRTGNLTSTKAGKVLGVKPQRVYSMIESVQ